MIAMVDFFRREFKLWFNDPSLRNILILTATLIIVTIGILVISQPFVNARDRAMAEAKARCEARGGVEVKLGSEFDRICVSKQIILSEPE